MFSAAVTIKNKTGLHARPASALVSLCQKYDSRIQIIHGNVTVNPKSIVSVLSGEIKQGTTITLTAEGPDEQEAGREILKFMKSLKE